jgi:hypothetical protein
MTITPEQLRARLDDELAPMPTVPRIRYAEVVTRAARRRNRRRRTYAGAGVTLLAAAAAVSAVVVVNRPSPQASVRPVAPPTTFTPASRPAVAGDVDGDGIADRVSVSGTTLTVVGTRVGTLTLTLPFGGYTVARAAVDIGDSGYGDVVLEQQPGANGPTYSLVALEHPDGAHPALGLVTTPDRQALELFLGGGDSDQWSWTCQSASGTLNQVGRLATVDYRGQVGTVVRTVYRLDGDLATQVSASTTAATAAEGQAAQAAEQLCPTSATSPTRSSTSSPTDIVPSSTTAASGIDGEQMGDGSVPDGTGIQIDYTRQPLVRRSFPGGSAEVPSGWVVKDASIPSDHSDIVIYDPANPTARFEFSGSGCIGCASKNGDDVTPNPTPPTATVSSVALPGGRSVAFTERPWLGYAVNGVVTVLTGPQDGTTGPIGGYVIYRVALPMDDTALETTILNSVTVAQPQ